MLDQSLKTIEQKDEEGRLMREKLAGKEDLDLFDAWSELMLTVDEPEVWEEPVEHTWQRPLSKKARHVLKVLGYYLPLQMKGINNLFEKKMTKKAVAAVMLELESRRMIRGVVSGDGMVTVWEMGKLGAVELGKDYSPKGNK